MEIKRISSRVWLEIILIFLFLFSSSFAYELERCFKKASRKYNINIYLLKAIAKVESNFNPYAININLEKENRSFYLQNKAIASKFVNYLEKHGYNFDIGICQINIKNIKRFGLSPIELLDPCKNIEISARILKELINRHGLSWEAVWRYNGNRGYALKIYKELKNLANKN